MKLGAGATLADGRYRLERLLGTGGMASVWLAGDARLDRPVAVKVISETLAHDERWLERFRREARIAAGLSHPNIVRVFDFGIDHERPFLVMEYVRGQTLAARLADRDGPSLDPDRLARELLDALAHVHGAGLIHRDVKPGNLLLDERDVVHLADFGIARAEDATALTQTGMVVGTLRYLAPEVAAGNAASVASDLFAAGKVIAEATGHAPFGPLSTLVDALTAVDPTRRPRSAAVALALLDEPVQPTARTLVSGRDRHGRAQPREASRHMGRRPGVGGRRLALWFAAGVAALAAVFGLVLGGSSGDERDGAPLAQPAAPGAPLEQQLDAMDELIDAARR